MLFCAIIIQPGKSPKEWVYISSLILSFHAAVAYFNIYFLVTQFLFKKQFFIYLGCFILSIIAVTYPIAIVFHGLVKNQSIKTLVWSWEFFLLNVGSIALTALLTLAIKLLFNWYQEEQVNKSLKQVNLQTELKFLKTQINPHFLFNSLNSLYALTLKKSDDAPKIVLKLSNILRYVLYEIRDEKVPLEQEIQYLRDYIELETIRVGKRIDIRFEILGETFNKNIEPMLFLTLVENSFKHGASQQIGDGGFVHLTLDLRERNTLTFIAANSVSSAISTKSFQSEPGGIGLENMKKRLDIIYPGKHQLEITANPNQYVATLKIQTKTENNTV